MGVADVDQIAAVPRIGEVRRAAFARPAAAGAFRIGVELLAAALKFEFGRRWRLRLGLPFSTPAGFVAPRLLEALRSDIGDFRTFPVVATPFAASRLDDLGRKFAEVVQPRRRLLTPDRAE